MFAFSQLERDRFFFNRCLLLLFFLVALRRSSITWRAVFHPLRYRRHRLHTREA